MNWFSNLFKKSVDTTHNKLPYVGSIVPMPKVKPTKPEKNTTIQPDSPWPRNKDISEPVFAIVECMKKYPSRFKIISNENEQVGVNSLDNVKIRDVKTNQEILVHIVPRIWESWSWQWLTRDEKDLLKESFGAMIEIKKKRLHSIQRAKMKGIYK